MFDELGSVAGGPLNTFTNKLAHMLAGCALGTAKADNSGGCCAACSVNPLLCAQATGIGGAAAGGADALGQWMQTGAVRPAQTFVATINGALATPLGMSTGLLGNTALAAYGSVMNASFQNAYYGDRNSVAGAAAMGSIFGIGGTLLGNGAQAVAGRFFPVYRPETPALFQQPNYSSTLYGVSAGAAVQGFSSFFPAPQK